MQATLLSIAIALILALVTALVGPHFVDWNKYRGEFESQASRMTGLQVRVAGPIDARLLPTPSLNLTRIDITRPGEAGSLRARRLSIEFSLGSLVRGEFKATDVILDGAEIAMALDRNGRLEWPAPSVGFDPYRDDLRVAELARKAVQRGRASLTPEQVNFLLAGKFQNPMLGILAAHLLILGNGAKKDLLNTVKEGKWLRTPEVMESEVPLQALDSAIRPSDMDVDAAVSAGTI